MSRTKEKEPLKKLPNPFEESEIEFSSGDNPYLAAFTSDAFKARVEKGFKRVRRLRAESGFSVVSGHGSIIFSPLQLGTRVPEDEVDESFWGEHASTPVGLTEFSFFDPHSRGKAREDIDYNAFAENSTQDEYLAMLASGRSLLGIFHFHPSNSPFSNSDFENYDDRLSLPWFSDTLSMYNGVFIPEWDRYDQRILPLTLFVFQGPPHNLLYQSADMERLDAEGQKKLLEECGFKAWIVKLPLGKYNTVDTSPLSEIFS